ncbi:MAG: amidase [Candidatus Tectimicrobiota bacterium]|nr:MAG: amidase [Candidatus Tectomicrobia bacterium]
MDDLTLCYTPATQLAAMLRRRVVSPVEVVEACLRRIAQLNPRLLAYVTVAEEQARAAARAAEQAFLQGKPLGPLHGIPVSVKDLVPTAGIRTTFGSKIYEHFIPEEDGLIVQRLKAAGAIILGKTNTPEFGAGANTYNAVCGATRNPWNPALTCGGSSGGAAVALATGMGPLATGSDLGGSLRIPASFCGVVGFRTTPGLVPVYPSVLGWDTLSVQGPMARTVADTALMLSVIAGEDERVPISYPVDTRAFLRAVQRPQVAGLRVAWTPDLGGLLPVAAEVKAAVEAAVRVFADLGAVVCEATPDFSGVQEIIHVTRAAGMITRHGDKLPQWREVMNPNLVWNIEQGAKLSARDWGLAEQRRTELWLRVQAFFRHYDLLLTPTVAILPFPVEESYPQAIAGHRVASYIDWFLFTYAITLTGLPAISVPCGWTAAGLPVGLQIVGRRRAETTVLRAAAAFEEAAPWAERRPPL